MSSFRELGKSLSNWGRWGPDDEIGTLNLIGRDQVRAAAAQVRSGEVVSMGLRLAAHGPQPGQARGTERFNPVHLVTERGYAPDFRGDICVADDHISMPLQASTQFDALAHISYDGQMYNGFSNRSVTWQGATYCGIDKTAAGVTGRGVLLDVARFHGLPTLPSNHLISSAELDAVAAHQGVEILPGDILLLRTGWIERFKAGMDVGEFWTATPGLLLETATWLREHDIAAVAADNTSVEATASLPDGPVSPSDPEQAYPFHMVAIRDLGLTLGELFDLEKLGESCARDGRYEFLFSAPNLLVPGGLGSPLNPLATK
ncbi:cyclase family protein [Actinomycetospora atypica]|uniref:Cyclase family protein n=1 Tax=Actinomycetospora atypica TaxID=1290095 RepID=A0ABV9YRM9_9PSEU